MNLFALAVIGLFTLAAIAEGFTAKGFFYLCSAAINVAVVFMK